MGAVCPWMRRAPGACDASHGDRPCPAPVWKRAAILPRPRPLPVPMSLRGGRLRGPEVSPTPPVRRRPLRRCHLQWRLSIGTRLALTSERRPMMGRCHLVTLAPPGVVWAPAPLPSKRGRTGWRPVA